MARRPAARRGVLAVLAGVLLFVGHPPAGVGAAGFVAILPLVVIARDIAAGPDPVRRRVRAGAGWGLLSGLLAFGLLVPWLIPFGVVAYAGLVVVQAAFVAGYVALLAAYGERPLRAAVAVGGWVVLEAARSAWPLGGFSWGALAYTQADGGLALGVARTLGATGVSLVLATVAVALEETITRGSRGWAAARGTDVPADALFTAMRTPILVVLGVLTAAVLASGEAPRTSGRSVEVGIVQGGETRATSAAGVARIDSDRIERVTDLVLDATEPFAEEPPDLLVWPENSLDADVRTDAGAAARRRLEEALQLVAPTPILAGETASGPRPRTLLNQMTVFTLADDGELAIGDSYTKRQPVPFGEYVPVRSLLGWFPPLQQIPFDVLPGGAAQVIDVAGARVGTIICFENTFPALAHDQVRQGADVLVVSTNNSSFGDTAMSAQHLAFSRLRAVETGRWVVHAGISGISAFIDPEGEVLQATEQFAAASIQRAVPLVDGTTPAVHVSRALPWVVAAATLAAAAVGIATGRRTAPRGAPSS